MTPGHRVARSSLKSSKAVRRLFPWAERLVRVDGVWVAYESAEDAMEEHGPVVTSKTTQGYENNLPMVGSLNWGLLNAAKRRGEI